MSWNRKELKNDARMVMKGTYWNAVFACFLLVLASAVAYGIGSFVVNITGTQANQIVYDGQSISGVTYTSTPVLLVFTIFLLNPLRMGLDNCFKNAMDTGRMNTDDIKAGFTSNYFNVIKIMFLRDLFIFLWSLLFIIPGIVKAYQYYMIPYILADNPNIESKDAFEMSKKMMDGEKMNTFVLELSFIGWIILTLATCGIAGIFFYFPYSTLTMAGLYNMFKARFSDAGSEAEVDVEENFTEENVEEMPAEENVNTDTIQGEFHEDNV